MNETSGAKPGRGRLIVYCLFGLMFFFSISAAIYVIPVTLVLCSLVLMACVRRKNFS